MSVYTVREVYGDRFGVYKDDKLDIHFPTQESAQIYADKQQTINDCTHEWQYLDDEYGSLADGGSYEIYYCIKCVRRRYVPLAD